MFTGRNQVTVTQSLSEPDGQWGQSSYVRGLIVYPVASIVHKNHPISTVTKEIAAGVPSVLHIEVIELMSLIRCGV